MYVQWLANCHSSPSTIKNYLSGAKNWVLEHKGSVNEFFSHEVAKMVKSVTKHSQHVVRRAAPIFPNHLVIICSYCDYNLTIPLCVKPCILLGHALFFRASNLVLPSSDVWTGPHTLQAIDVKSFPHKLVVHICSTKTQVKPTFFTVYPNSCTDICPVHAWNHYVAVLSPPKLGPAFITSQRRPLTAKLVVACMRDALAYDSSIDVSQISMHSLRPGAAQSAALAGSSEEQIMSAGSWASKSGLKPYLAT